MSFSRVQTQLKLRDIRLKDPPIIYNIIYIIYILYTLYIYIYIRVRTQLKLRDMWLKDVQESNRKYNVLQVIRDAFFLKKAYFLKKA